MDISYSGALAPCAMDTHEGHAPSLAIAELDSNSNSAAVEPLGGESAARPSDRAAFKQSSYENNPNVT